MEQDLEISFSSVVAVLLLKDKVVTDSQISVLLNELSSKGVFVYDDEDDFSYTYLCKFLYFGDNYLALLSNLDYDSYIENDDTVRAILEDYAGDMLLEYIGYVKSNNVVLNTKVNLLTRVKKLFHNFDKNKVKSGI